MNARIASSLTLAVVLAAAAAAPGRTATTRKSPATTAAAPSADERAAARKRALRDGWPDTPAGMVASGWVEAFARGEPAMRAFLAAHLSAEALTKRPMSERLASYRSLRERYGAPALASVVESKPAQLTVELLADDAARHRFVFEVEPQAPHRLVSVTIHQREFRHGGHGSH